MAILQLVDQLSDMLNQGWQLPLTRYRMVNADDFGKMLERMRITVPSSIKESERTLAERDAILATAHAEAKQIIQAAEQKVSTLLAKESVVALAQEQANRVIADAQRVARQRTLEADSYATQVLQDLSAQLHAVMRQIENGIQVMQTSDSSSPPNEAEQ